MENHRGQEQARRRAVSIGAAIVMAIISALLATGITWFLVHPTDADFEPRATQLVDDAGRRCKAPTYGAKVVLARNEGAFMGIFMPNARYPGVHVRRASVIGSPSMVVASFNWHVPQHKSFGGFGGLFAYSRHELKADQLRPLDAFAVPQSGNSPVPQLIAHFSPLPPGAYVINAVEIEFEKGRHRQTCSLEYDIEITVE